MEISPATALEATGDVPRKGGKGLVFGGCLKKAMEVVWTCSAVRLLGENRDVHEKTTRTHTLPVFMFAERT